MASNVYSNSHCLGNGLEEIEFFSKNIDYDKELYESHFLEKDNPESDGSRYLSPEAAKKHKELVKIWERGGPVKVLTLPDFDFDVYPLYFKNFQELDYYGLKELLGNFFTLCEFENLKVRVTYKTEKDLRVGYQALIKDPRYDLQIFVDIGDYLQKQKNNFDKKDPSKNKTGQRLIKQWLNNGDVVIETSKHNCYPIQIKNYKQYNYDELMELFSKYGKFTSIAQLENEYVQVKFCTEEAAQKCFIDLKKNKNYNVRLLFFLKELNTKKKLVKEIVTSKLDAHVTQLLNAEERIKFDTNQIPVKRESSRMNRKNKKKEQQKTDKSTQIDDKIIYYKKNCENGNVYVKGIPFENPFLTPPYSYKVWKNKQNHLPAPPPEDSEVCNYDANYEYYLRSMKVLSHHSHSSCSNSSRQ